MDKQEQDAKNAKMDITNFKKLTYAKNAQAI